MIFRTFRQFAFVDGELLIPRWLCIQGARSLTGCFRQADKLGRQRGIEYWAVDRNGRQEVPDFCPCILPACVFESLLCA